MSIEKIEDIDNILKYVSGNSLNISFIDPRHLSDIIQKLPDYINKVFISNCHIKHINGYNDVCYNVYINNNNIEELIINNSLEIQNKININCENLKLLKLHISNYYSNQNQRYKSECKTSINLPNLKLLNTNYIELINNFEKIDTLIYSDYGYLEFAYSGGYYYYYSVDVKPKINNFYFCGVNIQNYNQNQKYNLKINFENPCLEYIEIETNNFDMSFNDIYCNTIVIEQLTDNLISQLGKNIKFKNIIINNYYSGNQKLKLDENIEKIVCSYSILDYEIYNNLTHLELKQCDNITIKNMSSLKYLHLEPTQKDKYFEICDCYNLEKMFIGGNINLNNLPKLEVIKVKNFCYGSIINLPLLKKLVRNECENYNNNVLELRDLILCNLPSLNELHYILFINYIIEDVPNINNVIFEFEIFSYPNVYYHDSNSNFQETIKKIKDQNDIMKIRNDIIKIKNGVNNFLESNNNITNIELNIDIDKIGVRKEYLLYTINKLNNEIFNEIYDIIKEYKMKLSNKILTHNNLIEEIYKTLNDKDNEIIRLKNQNDELYKKINGMINYFLVKEPDNKYLRFLKE